MNEAQMRKLQKKVAAEVGKKTAERNKKEYEAREAHLQGMASEMARLETANPKRGPCHCQWRGEIYLLRDGHALKAPPKLQRTNISHGMERIHSIADKSFYMMSEEQYREGGEYMRWMSENYAFIKLCMHKASSEDVHEKLTYMSTLGGIFEDMQKKFPKRTPLDLKAAIEAIDLHLSEELSSI